MADRATIEIEKVEYLTLIQRIKFFQSMALKISERKPLNDLLNEIIFTSKTLLNAEAASLLLYNKVENNLYFHTVKGGSESSLESKTLNLGEGIGGCVALERQPEIINDCYNDPRFNKEFDKRTGFKTRNMVCVPMINKEELIGVIQAINKKNDDEFNYNDLELFEALAAQCAVAIENARLIDLEIKAEQIRHDMETAYNIQQRFLPSKLPQIPGIELSVRLKSEREIGGDYFNIKRIDENRTLFFVADVTGKSIPAALIVSTLYSFLQFYFIVNNTEFNPVNFMQNFNKFLMASTNEDKFATAWLGVYDHVKKVLVSINAGHNPTYLLKRDEDHLQQLNVGGLMLGCIDLPYNSETIELMHGDTLIFYTDGIPEAMNEQEEEFGVERFEKLLLINRDKRAGELSKLIFDEIKKYRGSAEQSDDITLGIVKF